jgi:hypothetical protein
MATSVANIKILFARRELLRASVTVNINYYQMLLHFNA